MDQSVQLIAKGGGGVIENRGRKGGGGEKKGGTEGDWERKGTKKKKNVLKIL